MVKKAKTTQSVPETTMLASPSLGRRKLTKSNTGEIDGGSPFAEKGFASMQNHKNTIVGNVLLCSELKVDKGLSSSQPRFDTEDNVQDKEILLGRQKKTGGRSNSQLKPVSPNNRSDLTTDNEKSPKNKRTSTELNIEPTQKYALSAKLQTVLDVIESQGAESDEELEIVDDERGRDETQTAMMLEVANSNDLASPFLISSTDDIEANEPGKLVIDKK